jgi:O-antigen/teichoic acid export membrane protein
MITRALASMLPAQMFRLVISLLLQVLIARLLLPEGRGLYAICIAISAVLLVVTFFGNEFGIRFLLAKERITPAQALRYLLLTAAISWSASLALVWLGKSLNVWPTEKVTWTQLVLACTFSFSQLITTQINVFMTIRGQFYDASVISVAEEMLKFAIMAVLLLKWPSVEVALFCPIIGNLLSAAYCTMRYNFYARDFDGLLGRDLWFIYRYGMRSLWLNLTNLSNAHVGTLVLAGLMSAGQVGIYNLAFGLIARLQVLPDALNRVLVPASMRSDDQDHRFKMVQLSVTGLLAFSLVVVPLLGAFNRPIMRYAFGPEYIDAGPVAFLLIVGFVFKIVGKPLEAHFNEIVGNPTAIAVIQVFGMSMMALLTHYGAAEYGLIGAAIGSSAAMILSSIALLVAYTKSANRSAASLISFRPLVARFRQMRRRGQ